MSRIIVLLILIVALASLVHAQDGPALGQRFATVTPDGVLIVNTDGSTIPVSNPDYRSISSLVWSPDGTRLVYVLVDDQFNAQVRAVDTTTGESFPLNTGALDFSYPLIFTPEGDLLYFGQPDFTQQQDDMTVPVTVSRIAPQADAQPQIFATVYTMMPGCGGGSSYPSDWIYWEETGFGGRPQFVALTDFGLLYTPVCGGSGLNLADLTTGITVELASPNYGPGAAVVSPALSPDGTRIAAIQMQLVDSQQVRHLILIDLPSGAITELADTADADQVAWVTDGSALVYSTRAWTGNLADALTPEGAQTAATALGVPLDQFEVPATAASLRRIDLTTGEQVELFSSNAWAIGRIFPMADRVIFSEVSSLAGWLDALAYGQLDLTAIAWEDQRALTPLALLEVTEPGTAPVLLATDYGQVVFAP